MRQFSEEDLLRCEENINLNDTMGELFGDFINYEDAYEAELNRACISNRFEIPEFLLEMGVVKYGYMPVKEFLGYLFEADTLGLRVLLKCKEDYYEKFLLDMDGTKYFSIWKYCTQLFNRENAERAMKIMFFNRTVDRTVDGSDGAPISRFLDAYICGDYSFLIRMVHAGDYLKVKRAKEAEERKREQERCKTYMEKLQETEREEHSSNQETPVTQQEDIKEVSGTKKKSPLFEQVTKEEKEEECPLHFVMENRRPSRNIKAKNIVPNRMVVEPTTPPRYEAENKDGMIAISYRGAVSSSTSYKAKGTITQKTEYGKSKNVLPKCVKLTNLKEMQSGYMYRDMFYSNLFELCSYLEVPVGYVSSHSYLWKKHMGTYDVTSVVDSYIRRSAKLAVSGATIRSDYELDGLADSFYDSETYSLIMKNGVARVAVD